MWFIVAVGVLNVSFLLYARKIKDELALLGAVATLFFIALGLNSLIAVENRFNMLPVAVASVLAAHFAVARRSVAPFVFVATLVFSLCVAVLGAVASEKMRSSAVLFPPSGIAYQCIGQLR